MELVERTSEREERETRRTFSSQRLRPEILTSPEKGKVSPRSTTVASPPGVWSLKSIVWCTTSGNGDLARAVVIEATATATFMVHVWSRVVKKRLCSARSRGALFFRGRRDPKMGSSSPFLMNS